MCISCGLRRLCCAVIFHKMRHKAVGVAFLHHIAAHLARKICGVDLVEQLVHARVGRDKILKTYRVRLNVREKRRRDYQAKIVRRLVRRKGVHLAAVYHDQVAARCEKRSPSRHKPAFSFKDKHQLHMLVPMQKQRGAPLVKAEFQRKIVFFGRYGFVQRNILHICSKCQFRAN